ncbi:MAG: nucleotidyltransferase family protein [Pseudomonadota bacterium]
MALLVACARSRLSEEHKAVIRSLLDVELDWDSVINNAIYHKVIPLLHRSLNSSFPDKVPAAALSRITTHLKESSVYTFIISASLLNVISLLQENEIPVLPVKGAMLAEKLYGSATMRSYSDVDILVHQTNLEKALNVLQENQYTLLPEGIPQTTFLKFLKYYHHGRLLDRNGILIELHWELSGFYAPEPITLEKLEPFLAKTAFNNCPTLALTNEMLFVFLCLHGNKHYWAKLDYVCSIAELLSAAPDLDWDVIMELGKKYRMTKRILISLSLASMLFASVIPEKMESLFSNNHAITGIAEDIIKNELSRNSEESKVHPLIRTMLYQPAAMDSKIDASRFILRSLIIPEHDTCYSPHIPDALFPLFFLYKPYRALTMPIRKIWQ